MERLSGLDASFLYFETSQMHMHVSIVALLDPKDAPGGFSFEKVQSLIASRIHLLPPFRRRPVSVPFDLHHPMWVEDPDFDIIHHVHRTTCPAPGGPKELAAICGRITSTPLARSRPLWEVWYIDGLEHDRVACLTKVHHCAVDGASGAELMVHLFSTEPDQVEVAPPVSPPSEKIPTDIELVRDALITRVKQPLGIVKLLNRTVGSVAHIVRRRRDPESPSGATPLTAPRTRFNGAITAHRSIAFKRLSLSEVKVVRKLLGATVNDVVLAICSGALRRYLSDRGELPRQPLIATCPISVRGGEAAAPSNSVNRLSAMFTSLATHLDDPIERLRAIQSVTRGAKEEHNAIGADMLQRWAEFAAPTTFALAARFYTRLKLADRHRPIHNLVISNVPGPPFALYLAGAKLIAGYPLGPVFEGAGLNVTVMSYIDSIDFGFNAATNSVPDLWALADYVPIAFEELRQAAQKAAALPAAVTNPAS